MVRSFAFRTAFSATLLLTGSAAYAEKMGPALQDVPVLAIAADEPSSLLRIAEVPPKPTEPNSEANADSEVLRERFPGGTVKIERHVAADEKGNYLNQGPWTQWDERGTVIARGEYKHGQRDGKWIRWYGSNEGKLFSGPGFQEFERPLGCEVTLVNGQLHGDWKIYDAKNRPVCLWHFENGQRQGPSTWFLPSGQTWQEVNFKDGQMDGELSQRGNDGKLAVHDKYEVGQRFAKETKTYSDGKKKSEGGILVAITYAEINYDWWTGTSETIPAPVGLTNRKHGDWVWWHSNGQKNTEGRYQYNKPVGKFTWWYADGQLATEGEYVDGLQNGKWVWRHPNGQKNYVGEFSAGAPVGNWKRWTADGKVTALEDYDVHAKDKSTDNTDLRAIPPLSSHEVPLPPRR